MAKAPVLKTGFRSHRIAGSEPALSAKWGYLPTGEATGLSFRKSGFEPQYPCHFHWVLRLPG